MTVSSPQAAITDTLIETTNPTVATLVRINGRRCPEEQLQLGALIGALSYHSQRATRTRKRAGLAARQAPDATGPTIGVDLPLRAGSQAGESNPNESPQHPFKAPQPRAFSAVPATTPTLAPFIESAKFLGSSIPSNQALTFIVRRRRTQPPEYATLCPDMIMIKTSRRLLSIFLAAFIALFATQAQASQSRLTNAARFVPANALASFGVNISAVKRTPIYERLGTRLLRDSGIRADFARIKRNAGIDPEKDLRSALVVFPPEFITSERHLVVIMEAKFDKARLIKALNKKLKLQKRTDAAGAGSFYRSTTEKGTTIAFRGPFLLISRAESSLLSSLRAFSDRGVDRRTVRFRTRRAAATQDLFIIAKPTNEMRARLKRQDPNLGKLRGLDAGLSARNGLALSIEAQFQTERHADDLLALLERGLREAKSDKTLRASKLDSLLRLIRLQRRGQTLKLDWKLTPKQVTQLIQGIEANIGGRSAPRRRP